MRCRLREPKGVAQSLAMTASSINGLTGQSAREAGKCYSKAKFSCPVSLCNFSNENWLWLEELVVDIQVLVMCPLLVWSHVACVSNRRKINK